jgi:hypothetical protein
MEVEICLQLLIFAVLTVHFCIGHETFMCTTNTDALKTKTPCSNELEEEVRSLKVQVRQLQTLLQQHENSHFTTIQGFPRGSF